jgi:hypothetical protein
LPVRQAALPSSADTHEWRSATPTRRAGAFFLHDSEMLAPTIFFVGFNLIVLTTNLIHADYSVAFGNFMLATAAALVVGKSVLVANALAVLRPFRRRPQRRSDAPSLEGGCLAGEKEKQFNNNTATARAPSIRPNSGGAYAVHI